MRSLSFEVLLAFGRERAWTTPIGGGFVIDRVVYRFSKLAITSTSHNTFFGKVFTATQERVGFDVK